jgi:DNA-binding protein HU-beta
MAKSASVKTISTSELIQNVANMHGENLPKKVTKELLNMFLEAIEEQVIAGTKARIDKLGILDAKDRAARKARNPQTGEEISLPASKKVSFRPAKSLKEQVVAKRR